MTKILVVDDEPDLEGLIQQKFRKSIRNSQYSFVFAENGRQALEKLNDNEDVDLVLTDINMPEMDGLTLLTKLNERDNFLKTVIVSAYGDMDNIRTAMNLGAFDFITKPIDFHDLEVTMTKTIKHVLELKQSAETLRENDTLKIYLKEINAQKKLKDRFFAIISHDLRGPVSSFQGLSDIIAMYIKKGKYDELEKMISEVEQATAQLSGLLDNLLNWASQEMSAIPYNPVEIDVNEMVESLFRVLHSSAISKSITLSNKVEPGIVIWADLNSTVTIFRNLINNALKFTEDNGTIEITADGSNDSITIKVSDTGIGIPEDKMKDLFKLTDASSTYGTKGEKGVGLGLQLVSEFTKLNKGELNVDSTPGKGTTFSVTLPKPA
ncbi:MAG: hybrid sensor histidine kinase/response regulator [Cyclobacteriaceae bacterium]